MGVQELTISRPAESEAGQIRRFMKIAHKGKQLIEEGAVIEEICTS